MENPRPEKVAVVDEVRAKLRDSDATVLTEYRGLNVPALAKLRNELGASGGEVKIYKNTLVRFAAHDLGLEIEDLLSGPTAITFVGRKPDGTAGDPVGVAKALKRYAGENDKLIIKGGLLGTARLTGDDVRALADVAPREQLLSEIAGLFAAPMAQFASLLDAIPRNFAYALAVLIDKLGGEPTPSEAPVEEGEAAPDDIPAAQAAPDDIPAAEAAPDDIPAAQAAPDDIPAAQAAPEDTPAAQAAPTNTES
jgi:large subunit ribosomal protein L10